MCLLCLSTQMPVLPTRAWVWLDQQRTENIREYVLCPHCRLVLGAGAFLLPPPGFLNLILLTSFPDMRSQKLQLAPPPQVRSHVKLYGSDQAVIMGPCPEDSVCLSLWETSLFTSQLSHNILCPIYYILSVASYFFLKILCVFTLILSFPHEQSLYFQLN